MNIRRRKRLDALEAAAGILPGAEDDRVQLLFPGKPELQAQFPVDPTASECLVIRFRKSDGHGGPAREQ